MYVYGLKIGHWCQNIKTVKDIGTNQSKQFHKIDL